MGTSIAPLEQRDPPKPHVSHPVLAWARGSAELFVGMVVAAVAALYLLHIAG
jgi:hypothetical protein